MQEFLNTELKPYSELTREEKHILLDAVIDSKCECFFEDAAINHCGWGNHNGNMEFMPYGVYRTKSKEYKKLDIPWQVIDEKWKYAAMDGDEEIFLFEDKPNYDKGETMEMWTTSFGEAKYASLCDILKLDTTGIVAEHSLTQRPERSDTPEGV